MKNDRHEVCRKRKCLAVFLHSPLRTLINELRSDEFFNGKNFIELFVCCDFRLKSLLWVFINDIDVNTWFKICQNSWYLAFVCFFQESFYCMISMSTVSVGNDYRWCKIEMCFNGMHMLQFSVRLWELLWISSLLPAERIVKQLTN